MTRRESELKARLERSGASNPAPPEGLAERIKRDIPAELFPHSEEAGERSRVGSDGKPRSWMSRSQNWQMAAGILCAVLVGLFAVRMGVRTPQGASEANVARVPVAEAPVESAEDLDQSLESNLSGREVLEQDPSEQDLVEPKKDAFEDAASAPADRLERTLGGATEEVEQLADRLDAGAEPPARDSIPVVAPRAARAPGAAELQAVAKKLEPAQKEKEKAKESSPALEQQISALFAETEDRGVRQQQRSTQERTAVFSFECRQSRARTELVERLESAGLSVRVQKGDSDAQQVEARQLGSWDAESLLERAESLTSTEELPEACLLDKVELEG